MRIENPYDSHVHWLMTGEMQSVLQLQNLKSPEDILNLKISTNVQRGDWIIGFGWNQNTFPDQKFPDRKILDQKFPTTPVLFTRGDGHAIWVNTEALKRSDLWKQNPTSPKGGEIFLDSEGFPTGILIDLACELIQKQIPAIQKSVLKDYLLRAQEIFHKGGITHIRDMTCTMAQWEVARELEVSKELKLAVEQNFDAFYPNQFDKALNWALRCRNENSKMIRVKGVKVFYDGALGSEGALLSQSYLTRPHHAGLQLLEDKVLSEFLCKTWSQGLEFSIHVIGDQAVDNVLNVVSQVKDQGYSGVLNLEHVELIRSDTIQKIKQLGVRCHMQPSHWLTDQHWLSHKIGELSRFAFPWKQLEENKVSFDFGSDSPVESPNLILTDLALQSARDKEIPSVQKNWWGYHEHSDPNWIPGCHCETEGDRIVKTVFNNETVYQNKN